MLEKGPFVYEIGHLLVNFVLRKMGPLHTIVKFYIGETGPFVCKIGALLDHIQLLSFGKDPFCVQDESISSVSMKAVAYLKRPFFMD